MNTPQPAPPPKPLPPWVRTVGAGLRRFHLWLVRPPRGLDPQLADFFPLSNYVHGMGLLAHVSFLLLFWWLDARVLVAVNVFSVGIFVLTFRFSRRGWLNPALLIGGLEVAAHQGLAVIYLGLNAGFQHYVLILVMGTLFYSHIPLWLRSFMAVLPAFWYLVLLNYGLHVAPLMVLDAVQLSVLSTLNAILFVGMLMGMAIYYQYAVALARDRAERMAASKTLFLANMSHELRTPLNAILGFSQILGDSADMAAGHRDKLASINRSGGHLLSLINRILDMSKLESGKLELQSAAFDLDLLLSDVRSMFSHAAASKGLALTLERTPALPPLLEGDALRLRQVLINLVSNAVKFTHAGRVDVVASLAKQQPPVGLRLRVEVQDTGIGISRVERNDLFQIFTQTESGRTSGQGTGLGLALSHRIVELMGGDMGVRSKPGRGSQFWFEVNLKPASHPPAHGTRSLPASAGTDPREFVPAMDLPAKAPPHEALVYLRQLPADTLQRLHAAFDLAEYDVAERLLATQPHPAPAWLTQQLADYRFDHLHSLTTQALTIEKAPEPL